MSPAALDVVERLLNTSLNDLGSTPSDNVNKRIRLAELGLKLAALYKEMSPVVENKVNPTPVTPQPAPSRKK